MAVMKGHLPADRWERYVYDKLKVQLPDDWVVIANVEWSLRRGTADRGGRSYVREGETDFVVLAPRLGLLVLEVKGSKYFRIAEDGRWYRAGTATGPWEQLDESPTHQANRNMNDVVDVVNARAGFDHFPGLYGYVAMYPQGTLATMPSALYDATTMLQASHMPDLRARLRAALLARGAEYLGQRFDDETVRRVTDILTSRPTEITKVDTPLEVREDSSRIDQLTRQQAATLRGIFQLPRVAVLGPAGSGKTVLAMWRLTSLIEEGKRALFVCYNKALAEHLRASNPELASSIHSVDKLLWEVASTAGQLPRNASGLRQADLAYFLREELPLKVLDIATSWKRSERYDAVIVDEGQDFSESQAVALQEFLGPDAGVFLQFADWRQDLFKPSAEGPVGAEVVFTLSHNCRNTSQINLATNRITTHSIASMPGVPEGVEPIVHHCGSDAAMVNEAWRLANEWRDVPGKVAILSPRVLENSCMADRKLGHRLRLTTALSDWVKPDVVYFSTIKSFKGIEAGAVICVDLELPGKQIGFEQEDLYVPCTRPTTRLALLTRNKQAAEAWKEPTQG